MKSGKLQRSGEGSPTNRGRASDVASWTVETCFKEEMKNCRHVSKDDINVPGLVADRCLIKHAILAPGQLLRIRRRLFES